MTIGLILLAILAILIFFGLAERFFRQIGLNKWVAFLLVVALVVGAIVPNITIGGVFSLNFGGFLVPLIIITVLMAIMKSGAEVLRSLLAIVAVAAVAVATRMLIEPTDGALILASSLIIGFVGGGVAFLVGQTRLSTLAAAMGGIILGDIIINFVYTFVVGGYVFALGSYGVFDSIIIASIFGILICQAVLGIRNTTDRRKIKRVLATEAAEDQDIDADNVAPYGTINSEMDVLDRDIKLEMGAASAVDNLEFDSDDEIAFDRNLNPANDSKVLNAGGGEQSISPHDHKLTGADNPVTSEEIESFFDDYV